MCVARTNWLGDFDLVGYSLGGVAMECARADRINNLVLIEPGLMERADWQRDT